MESHGQRYCVRLAAPVQKDAPELLGSFERFWRTSKRSPVERICHLPCYPLLEVSEQGGDHKPLLCLSPTLRVNRSRDNTASHLKGYRRRYHSVVPLCLCRG